MKTVSGLKLAALLAFTALFIASLALSPRTDAQGQRGQPQTR